MGVFKVLRESGATDFGIVVEDPQKQFVALDYCPGLSSGIDEMLAFICFTDVNLYGAVCHCLKSHH